MLKQLVRGGVVLAAFAGLALATPAQADSEWPFPSNENEFNIVEVSDNVVICGNRGTGATTTIGDITGPVVFADDESVDCSIRVSQED